LAHSIWFWVGFNAFVLLMLALDLGIFHRRAHEVRLREAATWSAVWVAVSLLFNAGIWLFAGKELALQFLAGYLVEKSLAVDNVFVIALIFSYFAVPALYQHRVLFWGILGALVMRGAFIAVGAYALERWHWTLYLFGGLLLVTGIKLALRRDDEAIDLAGNPVLKLVRRLIPVSNAYDGQRFFTRENGRRMATPLLLALVMVEVTDLIFAVDSIPAVFAVTSDPFVVYTSNVLAILGLRSMYFLLAGVVHRFVYLKMGLALVLVFVGAKMLLADVVKLPILVSLAVIAVLIGGAVAMSLLRPPPPRVDADDAGPEPPAATDASPPRDVVARRRLARRRAAKARRARAALAARRRETEAQERQPRPAPRLKLRLRGY
jgi:tellurite resistance protein TerC